MQFTFIIEVTILICVIQYSDPVRSLECYFCTRQNGLKCSSHVRTCAEEEDTCQTEIGWGNISYWKSEAEKEPYLTKQCAKKVDCEERRNNFSSICHQIWNKDWKCAECCQEDLCNYYSKEMNPEPHALTMGAGTLKTSLFISACCVITHWL